MKTLGLAALALATWLGTLGIALDAFVGVVLEGMTR